MLEIGFSRNLTQEEFDDFTKLAKKYYANEVVDEFGVNRWIGLEWSKTAYHQVADKTKWYVPRNYVINIQCYRVGGIRTISDYLDELAVIGGERHIDFVLDVKAELRKLDEVMNLAGETPASLHFMWVNEDMLKNTSRTEVIAEQIRSVVNTKIKKSS